MASRDQDLQMQIEVEENRHVLMTLKDLFDKISVDGGGTITLPEFETHLQKDEVRVVFQSLGLEVSDAVSFFRILDVDGSQELEIDEFVIGCCRYKGKTKTIDLEVAIMDMKILVKKINTAQCVMDDRLSEIESSLGVILKTLDEF